MKNIFIVTVLDEFAMATKSRACSTESAAVWQANEYAGKLFYCGFDSVDGDFTFDTKDIATSQRIEKRYRYNTTGITKARIIIEKTSIVDFSD